MIGAIIAVLQRDLTLALRSKSATLQPLLFYIIIVALFPLGLNPAPALLLTLLPAILWVAALLAALLAVEPMFRSDFADGSLAQMALSGAPLPALMFAKVLANWLVTGLPAVLIAPVLVIMLGGDADVAKVMCYSLLLGTPILTIVGSIAAALTAGLNKGGALNALLVLPLNAPILIFGAGATTAALEQLPYSGPLYLLAAMLAAAITLAPFAIASAVKIALEQD